MTGVPELLTFRHTVTFGDTNAVGNVYFSNYFALQGKYREEALARFYPEFVAEFERGFGLITEFAHMDFDQEAVLFDQLLTTMYIVGLSRTRIEFRFEFRRASDGALLATGSQAVIYVSPERRPALMPDGLFDQAERYMRAHAPA